jgi:hypothetical protein
MAGNSFLAFTSSDSYWSNPSQAFASDNLYSNRIISTAYGGVSFNFSSNSTTVVPLGESILGVVITVEAKCSYSAATILSLTPGLDFGSIGITSTEAVHTVGSPTNSLGISSRSQLESLVFRFGDASGSANNAIYIDNITMRVYWGTPLQTVNVLFFGENF